MEYVTYDETGALTGAYLQDLLPEHAQNYFEVGTDQRMNWPSYRMNSTRDGLELAPMPEMSPAAYNAPILAALLSIDAKTPRAVREAIVTGDNSRIEALEADAAALRLQLRKA